LTHSLNEIGGLCKRAARGAGFGWGLAEEAANGARWLSAFGLPGPRLLAERLERFDATSAAAQTPVSFASPWRGSDDQLCPIIVGATLSDRSARFAADRRLEIRQVLYPLLCSPFAADVALSLGHPVRMDWNGLRLTTDGQRLVIEGVREQVDAAACDPLRCSLVTGALPVHADAPRIRGQVDSDTWSRLWALAERVNAPATEASRRLGAGGGDDG